MSKRKNVDWKPLGEREKRELAKWASNYANLANLGDSMRELAKNRLDGIFWYWTADAIHPDGHVVRDAIKHDLRYLHHTQAAWDLHGKNRRGSRKRQSAWGKGLQHEHVVPKAYLSRKILGGDCHVDTIHEVLARLCIAAVVTANEHRHLLKLPPDWDEKEQFFRYNGRVVRPPCVVYPA
ncbi:MAG: hypothetical protein H6718_07715 [Polyangiaceae bacterium]|nr:hypothetical protein [Polyangiaceae bacterium]